MAAGLKGRVESDVDIKATAEQFFDMWCKAAHKLPDVSGHIKAVEVHDGHWDLHGAIKFWNYTIDGRDETFKERLEFDEETKKIVMVGLEGDVFKDFKTFNPTYEITPKPDGTGCVVKAIVEYEKLREDVPDPNNYLDMAVNIAKHICDHHSASGA